MSSTTRSPVLATTLLLLLAGCGGTSEARPDGEADSTATEATEATATAQPGTVAEDGEAAAEGPAGDGEVAADGEAAGRKGTTAGGEATEREETASDGGAAAPERRDPEPEPARMTLAAGVEMRAALDDSLDTETLAPGDAFSATVGEAVVQDPYVAVPTGSRVYGRVTEMREPSGEEAGVIVLALDSIRVRGTVRPLAAEITDTQVQTRGEMKDEGKKIGAGAAAGALLGAIVGKDVKGAVIGAAAGAAAGTAVALGTKERYGVLPKGSVLTLRLTEPLEVPAPR